MIRPTATLVYTSSPIYKHGAYIIAVYYSCHIMFCSPIILCLVNCIIETIQPIEGRKYSSRGFHVGQHCRSLRQWIFPLNTSQHVFCGWTPSKLQHHVSSTYKRKLSVPAMCPPRCHANKRPTLVFCDTYHTTAYTVSRYGRDVDRS